MGKARLQKAYPCAKQKDENCDVAGFGEKPIKGDVFIIPEFILSDGNATYKIIDLQIAVCDHPQIGCDFVLSDTMFSHADTLFFRRNQKHVDIVYDKKEYHCTARYEGERFTVVTWAQNKT
jgi:hypothetical protein